MGVKRRGLKEAAVVVVRELGGEGGLQKLENDKVKEKERGKGKGKWKFINRRRRGAKQQLPPSSYHMLGPPFLRRSIYSPAFSHTGGSPVVSHVDLFKQSSPHPPPGAPYPKPPVLSAVQSHHLHSLTESPASFHRNPTLTESDSCHQTERKELGNHTHSALASPPSLWPSARHTHKQSKKRNFFFRPVQTQKGANGCLVFIFCLCIAALTLPD